MSRSSTASRSPVLAAVAMLVLAGCASTGAADGHRQAHALGDGQVALVAGQPDSVIAGPQGRRGQFVVECGPSHTANDDPILYPGVDNASHLHEFFGNTLTHESSTPQSLRGGPTTCQQQLDHASYWSPALYRDGDVVPAVSSIAYYRAGPGVDPTKVEPYPFGLMMIAGDASATVAPQPLAIAAWTCGTGIDHQSLPPVCPDSTNLRLVVTFPDCWNGVDLGDADPRAHVVYSSGGACPSGFPVHIPQLQFNVEFDHTGPTDGLELASGGLLSGHADFVNAWEPAKLAGDVELCIHRDLVCNVSSDR